MIDYDAIIKNEHARTRITSVERVSSEAQSPQQIQSWNGYAFAYMVAFEELARLACESHPRQDYLRIPLAYMARHSIELSLKMTLRDLGIDDQSFLKGHKILKLIQKVAEALHARQMDGGVNWMKRCTNWTKQFEELDGTSELLRYPMDNMGNEFPGFEIDLESLIRAHESVTMLCDCISTAVSAEARTYHSVHVER